MKTTEDIIVHRGYDFEKVSELCDKRPPRKKLEYNLIPDHLQKLALEAFRKGELVEF